MSAEGSQWKGRQGRSSAGEDGPEEDFGPVTWEELSNLRRNSVILFVSELHPNKISEWTLRAEPGRETKYYTCVLCRRLQDRGRRENPPVTFGPAARILVRNGRFLVHPDFPKTPHICGFAENPLSDRAAVLARRAMIRARTEISEDGLTPKQKINQVIDSFHTSEKYASLSEDEIAQMEAIVRGKSGAKGWSDSSCARSLYLNRRKLTSIKYGESRKIFECPIVGCDFLTTAVGMIDVHISETHKMADGDPEPGSYSKIYKYVDESEMHYAASNDSEGMSPSLQGGEEEELDPGGAVVSDACYGRGAEQVILFNSERFPNKISEWWTPGASPGEDSPRHYYCVLCRRIKEQGRRASPPVSYPPGARIIVSGGRFLVHPDFPKIPHICDFESNPMSDREAVMARGGGMNLLAAELEERSPRKRMSEMDDGSLPYKRRVNADWEAAEGPSCSRDVRILHPGGPSRMPKHQIPIYDDEQIEYVEATEIMSNDDDLGANYEIDQRMVSVPIITNMNQDRVPLHFNIQKTKKEPVEEEAVVTCEEVMPRRLLCSIVGCDYSTTDMALMDEHLLMHEALEEQAVNTPTTTRRGGRAPLKWIAKESERERGRPSRFDDGPSSNRFGTALRFDSAGSEATVAPSDTFGRVAYVTGATLDRQDVILYKSVLFPGRISEWVVVPTAADLYEFYECVLCRKKKRGNRRGGDKQPAARICVRDGTFLVDPDMPDPPHICDFETGSQSMGTAVLSRRKTVLRADGSQRNVTGELRRQMEALERMEGKKAATKRRRDAERKESGDDVLVDVEDPDGLDDEEEDDDISVGEADPVVVARERNAKRLRVGSELSDLVGEVGKRTQRSALTNGNEGDVIDDAVDAKSVEEMQKQMKEYLKVLENVTKNLRYDQLHSGVATLAKLSSSLKALVPEPSSSGNGPETPEPTEVVVQEDVTVHEDDAIQEEIIVQEDVKVNDEKILGRKTTAEEANTAEG